MAKMYYDKDADLAVLSGKKICVVGFGSQGHAQAMSLKDSGCDVVVAELPGSEPWARAEKAGMAVMETAKAAAAADIIHILAPDTIQPKIYESAIRPGLAPGNALGFSHGFNIRFGGIKPPADVDVYMVAPKGPGHLVRRQFVEGRGVPCLIAVEQDASGQARDIALAHAKGIGGTRAGVIETTFAEETETDLFGEQVVLCGGCTALVRAGFETLVEAGYQPEIAYFECLHELKLIVDLMYEHGMAGMWYSISDTAEYGDYTRGRRIISDETKAEMRRILDEITSGEFAEEWMAEWAGGAKNFKAMREKFAKHQVEDVGKKLRSMMSWISKTEL